jgi:hypothetical protein
MFFLTWDKLFVLLQSKTELLKAFLNKHIKHKTYDIIRAYVAFSSLYTKNTVFSYVALTVCQICGNIWGNPTFSLLD